MVILIFIIFLIIIGFILNDRYIKKEKRLSLSKTPISQILSNTKPNLWIYTEPDYNSRLWPSFYSRLTLNNYPNCLQLSIESIYKHCEKDFNIIHLTPKNIDIYIPELEIEVGPNSRTFILQKYQIISSLIMYKYGGLWLPPWVIIMRPLNEIIEKLKYKSIIVFGCQNRNLRCSEKSYPNIEVFASRPKVDLWKIYYEKLIKNNKIYLNSSYNYYNSGRCIFWSIFIKNLDIIYHYDSKYDGTRDYNGKLITNDELFSINNILLQDDSKCMFILYNYYQIYRSIYYRWFLRMSKNQILNDKIWISKLYRKSLKIGNIDNQIYNTSTRNT